MDWPTWTAEERRAYEPLEADPFPQIYRDEHISIMSPERRFQYLAERVHLTEGELAAMQGTELPNNELLNILELRIIRDHEARRAAPVARSEASPSASPEKI